MSPTKIELPNYTKGEEIFSAVSHIVGAAFGLLALILCLIFGVNRGFDATAIASLIVYGVSIMILYTMSALYHFLPRNRAKKVFRIFDHCTIYLLIAGTYTPICAIILRDSVWGWVIFSIVWIGAIIGITFNAINMQHKAVKIISMILYIVMGWIIIVAIRPLIDAWGLPGFLWTLAGGIAYTIGVIFYAFGKKARYIHSVWHLFVLLGTILHFVAIFAYIVL